MWLNIVHQQHRTAWSSYLNNSMSKNSCTIATVALCLALQACGSSGSGSGDQVNADPVFLAPVNAATLSDALTTEEPGVPSSEYWQCSVGGSGILLEYRFSSDSSGVETDVSNDAGAQSTFSWQTTSASAFTTTVTSTGGQNEVTDIAFNGRDAFNAVVNSSAAFACQRMGQRSEPIGPDAGTNSLSYSGAIYPLTHGFEQVFSFSPERRGDTHQTSQFDVADAGFRPLLIDVGVFDSLLIWRPDFATVWFRADLHSPGEADFTSATFQFEPDDVDENGPEVAGRFFFNEATFGVDLDGLDGIDSDTDEFIDAVAGTITAIRGDGEQVTMSFDVSLEDGTTLRGNYSGSFPAVDR